MFVNPCLYFEELFPAVASGEMSIETDAAVPGSSKIAPAEVTAEEVAACQH